MSSSFGLLADDYAGNGTETTLLCLRKMRARRSREPYTNRFFGQIKVRIVFTICVVMMLLRHFGHSFYLRGAARHGETQFARCLFERTRALQSMVLSFFAVESHLKHLK